MIKMVEEAADFMRFGPNDQLVLSDFTGTHGSPEFMDRAKALGKEVFQPKSAKSAVLGITGLKKILLNAYNTFAEHEIKAFSTKEEALDYLVE